MNHLPFTITAYLLNAFSVLIGKALIVNTFPNPLVYVFYFSAFSLIALLLLPITSTPNLSTLALASTSTILWTAGAYFLFKCLKVGQISRVVPIIGTLTPLILIIFAALEGQISISQIIASLILTSGLVFLTLPDWRGKISPKEILFEILSSILFAVSYLILRSAYLEANFLTVFVYSRLILIPLGIGIFLIPKIRKELLMKSSQFSLFSKMGLLFLVGQAAGGIAELLLTFSVSLANPALVNSLQGVQYLFLFFFSVLLGKKYPKIFTEKYTPAILIPKIVGILFISLGLLILSN